MNSDLRRLVHERLVSEDLLQKNWSSLVLAACDGRDALDATLQNGKATAAADAKSVAVTIVAGDGVRPKIKSVRNRSDDGGAN